MARKKKTYALAQEEELGAVIDRSIHDAAEQKEDVSPASPIAPDEAHAAPATISAKEPKKIMKNIWVPQPLDAKIKVLRAWRKAQDLPATFDAIANEALTEYVKNHIAEAIEWGSA